MTNSSHHFHAHFTFHLARHFCVTSCVTRLLNCSGAMFTISLLSLTRYLDIWYCPDICSTWLVVRERRLLALLLARVIKFQTIVNRKLECYLFKQAWVCQKYADFSHFHFLGDWPMRNDDVMLKLQNCLLQPAWLEISRQSTRFRTELICLNSHIGTSVQ